MFSEEHEAQVRDEHGEAVLEALKSKVDRRQKELDLIGSVPVHRLDRRLYRTIGHNDQHFAEVMFQCEKRRYRALFVILEDEEKLVYVTVVGKEDNYTTSEQKRVIFSLFQNSREAREYALNQI